MIDYIILTIERTDSDPMPDMTELIAGRVFTLMKERNRAVVNVTANVFDREDEDELR